MSLYTLVLLLHVLSATLLLGTSVVGEPVVRAAARRTSRPGDLRAYLDVGGRMAPISPVAALLVLATGLHLTGAIGAWSQGWVQLSVALWLVNSVVAVAVVKPAVGRVAAEAGEMSDASIGPRLDGMRWSTAWTWGGDILATNDAVILCIMVLKPGLVGSLATVVLAYTVVVAGRMVLGRRSPQAVGSGDLVSGATQAPEIGTAA
jgi:uncharacterized membrane protein